MRIYDISIALHTRLACWPGDAPYAWRWSYKKSEGATVNVGCVSLSVHAGTHTDAPFHFADDGLIPNNPELPLVLKPRFGSWGRDVTLCRTQVELDSRLSRALSRLRAEGVPGGLSHRD